MPISRPLDIERGTELLAPYAMWLGHTAAAPHLPHLRTLSSSLARAVAARHAADAASRAGGVIVNTCGWVDGGGYELLLHQANVFGATVLVVIGDDRLHSQLSSHAAASATNTPTVIKLAKSGGVITRSDGSRAASMRGRVHEYFYGVRRELYPHSTVVDFSQLEVYSIAAAPQPPPSALPIGVKLPEDQMASTSIPPSHYPSLSHSLLAVVRAPTASCDDLLDAACAGYVWVQHVDLERQKVQILAPSGLQAPTLRLLAGSIKWSGESFN